MTSATKKSATASTEKKSSSRAITPKVIKKTVKQAKSVAKHGVMTPKQKMDAFGVDTVCDMIMADVSLVSIADRIGVHESTLRNWIASEPTRSARTHEARIESAAACDRLALAALVDIPDDGTNAQVARQREIASHYRWRAKTRNPREYGDAIKVDADIKVTPKMEDVDARILQLQALMLKK